MSHFYGTLRGNRGEATRCGEQGSGIHTVAASWKGCIVVDLHHDKATGEDRYTVRQGVWHGAGIHEVIAEGVIGRSKPQSE